MNATNLNDTVALSTDIHDPGGKVKIRLPDGLESGAVFSDCQKYRQLLFRRWHGAVKPGYLLWIGMNPSTADGLHDDPTVKKERKYTAAWGYGEYRKCNVMDYRATNPKMLMGEGVQPCSDANLPCILEQARNAAMVILAFGAPHKKLRQYGEKVLRELARMEVPTFCLAITKDGLPVHPLYQKDSALPRPFPG